MKRNEIYDELLKEVQKAYKFKIASRRPSVFEQTNSFPALYLDEDNEESESVRNVPIKLMLSVNLIVYTSVGNSKTATPFNELNDIIDNISDLFNPSKNGGLTNRLNGKVESCYIRGTIEKMGNDETCSGAIAIIPIKIVVANN